MEEIEFRIALKTDKYAIADLLSLSSNHLRPINYWNWINNKILFPGSFVVLATLKDKIVGHYAVSIRKYRIFGVTKKIGVATQTVIHPSYRKLKILLDISNFLKAECQKNELSMVIGFPNDNLYRLNTKLLGWIELGEVAQLEASLDKLPNCSPFTISNRALKFDDKFNHLIKFYNFNKNSIKEFLTPDLLNWRYFNHPLNNYTVFISSDDNGSINGFIVLKIYHKETELVGHVMEIVTFDDVNIMDYLLERAIGYFSWANCEKISLWCGVNDFKYDYFKKMGLKENQIESHMQVLPLIVDNNKTFNISNWDLSMRMSDAY